jgi:hypothetical protein
MGVGFLDTKEIVERLHRSERLIARCILVKRIDELVVERVSFCIFDAFSPKMTEMKSSVSWGRGGN